VFVLVKTFQTVQIFVSKGGAYANGTPIGAQYMDRLQAFDYKYWTGLKNLSRTNATTYFAAALLTQKKYPLITLKTGPNVIKLFTAII
jgi:hypothetical protein